jgi:hypothetical protein
MQRFVSTLCCLSLTFHMTGVSVAAQKKGSTVEPSQNLVAACKQPCLEDGTPVKLRLSQTVSSADAHVDDRVEFEVLEEIKISDVLIVPKGGIAWGTVTEAQPKRRMARGGKLEIVMDSVRLADGERAALRATQAAKGGGHTGGMTAGIVATALIFWPAAPFFLFMHGKDITIPKGAQVPTFVNGNLQIDLAKFQAAEPSSQQAQTRSNAPPGGVSQVQGNADAQLEVTSTPNGADVELDGNFVGNTPSTIGVSPGDHTVGVRKNGYGLWERKIKVSSGKVNISAELEPGVKPIPVGVVGPTTPTPAEAKEKTEPAGSEHTVALALAHETLGAGTHGNLGTASFESDPTGAEVYVDDSFVGKAPVTLNLVLGQHSLRMFAKDYKNWSQQIMVVRASELTVTAKMAKAD